MPRRPTARTAASNEASAHSAPSSSLPPPQSLPENLILLRKQWKWAAISQFLFTFSPLLAMDDVTLKDIEDDLVLGSSLVLPRIIVRLLYTLSYDRKVNLNNWQTTLRRQYNKRNPSANPIGPEPIKEEDYFHDDSPEPESTKIEGVEQDGDADRTSAREQSMSVQRDGSTVKSEDGSMAPATHDPPSDDAPEQESKDWLSLPMMEKLDSLHLLTEWQFQSPNRVRTLMKSDDDQASWRIEPIGYDAKRNAYWLIGVDRLWIQRVPPKPPRPPPKNSLKRKRTAGSNQSPAKLSSPAKRPRLQPKTKNGKSPVKPATPTTASGRQGRAAKDQANIKLDAQAKELAELNRQAGLLVRKSRGAPSFDVAPSPAHASGSRLTRASTSSAAAAASVRPLGTRLSARLRGSQDEEWQAIPDEWLEDDNSIGKGKGRRRAPSPARSDANSSISELTELSEESDTNVEEAKVEEEEEQTVPAIADNDKAREPTTPEEFVEWETLAATLYDWEHIAERWQNATHYSEKALYKVLTNHIVPIITEELKEIEKEMQKKQYKEEVFTGRKRSSRLAIKESEKEEAKLAAKRKVEEAEKMSRARRAEARQQKEEAERVRRETAREERKKEREAKEAQEAREVEEKERKEREKEERAKQRASKQNIQSSISNGAVLLHHPGSNLSSNNGSNRGSRTPAGDDWELDCEICHRRGINLDDGVPLMCCGSCSKWQHIPCHDQADVHAGRPRRNWDQVDFICRQCRANTHADPSVGYNGVQMHYPQNMHPSLRAPHTAASYNHVPYGQGVGYDAAARMSNGFIDVPTVNGNKGYGTSDLRSSSSQAHIGGYSNGVPTSKQMSFTHYQSQQQQDFSHNGQDQQHYRDSTGYGHSGTTPSSYGGHRYGNHNNSQNINGWNGASNNVNHSLGYPSNSSSYMPGSAERSSALAESSSRYDQAAHYTQQQQQQQWRSHHLTSSQGLPQTNMPFATPTSTFHPYRS